MIEIEFKRFHKQDYADDGYELYVMKNGSDDVLYVGISTRSIWERWFGWNGHITWNRNTIYGESSIGRKIADHLPDSMKWKIQLWTRDDCIEYCKDVLPPNTQRLTIGFIEPFMIQKLSPILNEIYNLHPGEDTTPKSKKELEHEKMLDEIYKSIFEKKK